MGDQFSQLASKVLAGEASDEEKKSLQHILCEDSELTLKYNQLKEYWNADVKLTISSDHDNFKKNLFSHISNEPKVQHSKFRKLYLQLTAAAAILFFITTCTLAYLLTVSPHQLYTYSTQSSPADYVLTDGTHIKLNTNSSITYQSDYGKKKREVSLVGEAFFKVTKDKTKPFIVNTLGTKTEVLGTSFNVKSVSETGMVVTTLATGSVKFTAKDCNVLLHPGEEIEYNTNSHVYQSYSTDLQKNTSWITGRINYTGVRFGDLLERLKYIYNINIVLSDKILANRVVSASIIANEPIEDVLAAFEKDLEFTFKKDSSKITIISNKK